MKFMKENRKKEQYFIDRDGKCHKFKGDDSDIISIHYEIAHSLYPDAKNPDNILMNLGWILVGSSVYSSPIIHKKPTQAQINKLYDLNLFDRLCFLHKNSYSNYKKYGILCDD